MCGYTSPTLKYEGQFIGHLLSFCPLKVIENESKLTDTTGQRFVHYLITEIALITKLTFLSRRTLWKTNDISSRY